MELRQRHSHYTLMSESHAGFREGRPPAEPEKNSLAYSADLFAGLLQHDAVSLPLRQALLPVSKHTAAIYSRLFPESPCPDERCSLTLYDRLSIALTVAQLTDISLQCDFYANHLSPLAGPSGTKENNNRLTEITQYARQLACCPATASPPAISRLLNVGLTATDVLTLHHLCGFVRWQSRMMAGIMALAGIKSAGFFMLTSAPEFPELLTEKISEQVLPPLELTQLSQSRLEIIRACMLAGQPALPALVMAHATGAAQAWLILRAARLASLSEARQQEIAYTDPRTPDTARGEQQSAAITELVNKLERIPLRDCFAETNLLNRQGWKTDSLLQVMLIVASTGWDQALTPLS